MSTLGDAPLTALDAVRQVMEEDGTVAAYLQAGKVALALDLIERTIRHYCRDRSAEIVLDPTDRRISDRLAQRIIRHPLFSYDEKEGLLQVVTEPAARAEIDALLTKADAQLQQVARDLLLLLTPDDAPQ